MFFYIDSMFGRFLSLCTGRCFLYVFGKRLFWRIYSIRMIILALQKYSMLI